MSASAILLASVRNPLFTIFRCELRMQFKSMQFKGICILTLLIQFSAFQSALWRGEMNFDDALIPRVLPYYLIAVVFVGMHGISRLRSTGVHPVLMVRPFRTFMLMLGQWLAGVTALLVPIALMLFPAGMLLRFRYDFDYPLPPIFYAIAFYIIPAICCILALTIWIRTCFQSTIPALIVLTILFGLMIYLGTLQPFAGTDEFGNPTIVFVPLLSYFSFAYWSQISELREALQLSYFDATRWIRVGMSLLSCIVLLMLACYHLRRTEPQRKVLGKYGSRWYHAPTVLRLLADVRIDPHIGWKSHVALAVLIGFICVESLWPVARPHYNAWRMNRQLNRAGGTTAAGFDKLSPEILKPEEILQASVIHDKQIITPERIRSELKLRIQHSPQAKYLILNSVFRSYANIRTIRIEQREVPFLQEQTNYFIDAKIFDELTAGAIVQLTIEAEVNLNISSVNAARGTVLQMIRGYHTVDTIKSVRIGAEGQTQKFYQSSPESFNYPLELDLTLNGKMECIDTPVQPALSEKSAGQSHYSFVFPAMPGYRAIVFANEGFFEKIDVDLPNADIRIAAPASHARIMHELFEVMQPTLREFIEKRRFDASVPIAVFWSDPQFIFFIKEFEKIQYRLRRQVWINDWEKDNFFQLLTTIEQRLLTEINRKFWNNQGGLFDLFEFQNANLLRGINHKIVASQQYLPPQFTPVNRHLVDISTANRIRQLSRAELTEQYQHLLPVFQMLYLMLGQEQWQNMLIVLHRKIRHQSCTPELIEAAVCETAGEQYHEFFEYWLRSGTGYPGYTVEDVHATLSAQNDNELPQYAVVARIRNTGTANLPLPLLLRTAAADQPINDRLTIPPGTSVEWKFVVKERPVMLQLDPEGWLLLLPCAPGEQLEKSVSIQVAQN